MSPEAETKDSVFDARQPFEITIVSGGRRHCRVKFPTDGQWNARAAKQKINRTDLGRGKSQSKLTPLEHFDSVLFKEILLESPSDEFDEYEASLVIDRLRKAEVSAREAVGDDKVRVEMIVFGDVMVEVLLKQPRRRLVVEYGRAAVNVVNHEKGAETSVSLDASGTLFDQIFISAKGYAEGSSIPLCHKDVVAMAIINSSDPE
jgi:hypothetical protein